MAEGKYVTAGNANQQSDGSSTVILMDGDLAAKRGITPMGWFRGFAAAGCEPDEVGIGPIFTVPRLLERHGLKVSDIGLWELNEPFASQCLYSRDKLGIDPAISNVNGGAIAIGHPYRMTRARRRPCPDRGQKARREICRRHHVCRRRHGCGRPDRNRLNQGRRAF